jgi:hypothetical protein
MFSIVYFSYQCYKVNLVFVLTRVDRLSPSPTLPLPLELW